MEWRRHRPPVLLEYRPDLELRLFISYNITGCDRPWFGELKTIWRTRMFVSQDNSIQTGNAVLWKPFQG